MQSICVIANQNERKIHILLANRLFTKTIGKRMLNIEMTLEAQRMACPPPYTWANAIMTLVFKLMLQPSPKGSEHRATLRILAFDTLNISSESEKIDNECCARENVYWLLGEQGQKGPYSSMACDFE